MIHFKRLLWLAAWSVWLWLGFGLYRELPRDFGPVAYRLPLRERERAIRFLPDGRSVMTIELRARDQLGRLATTFSVVEIQTGKRLRSVDGPTAESLHLGDGTPELGHYRGSLVLASEGPARGSEAGPPGLYLFDLADGRSLRIASAVEFAFLHEERPWVLFIERLSRRDLRIGVFDHKAGKMLFERPTAPDRLLASHPFFLFGDRLAIPVKSPEEFAKSDDRGRFEIWSLGSTPSLRIVEAEYVGVDARAAPSRSSLVAFSQGTEESMTRFDVVDIETGTLRATFPQQPGRFVTAIAPVEPRDAAMSASGRTVLGGKQATLWEVETGRKLWTACERDFLVHVEREGNSFHFGETWFSWIRQHAWLRSWINSPGTVANRDLETGRLLYRTWASPVHTNSDGSLGLDLNGTIYQLPPLVNWRLLAICQIVLALPLILFWAVLRWRRKKKAMTLS